MHLHLKVHACCSGRAGALRLPPPAPAQGCMQLRGLWELTHPKGDGERVNRGAPLTGLCPEASGHHRCSPLRGGGALRGNSCPALSLVTLEIKEGRMHIFIIHELAGSFPKKPHGPGRWGLGLTLTRQALHPGLRARKCFGKELGQRSRTWCMTPGDSGGNLGAPSRLQKSPRGPRMHQELPVCCREPS